MTLTIIDNTICCKTADTILWAIPIVELVFIGEYTTSAGPWFDDWFYVFSNKYDTWYEAPFEVSNDLFWVQLNNQLDCELAPNLANSTVWKSNVIYPVSLNGEELFMILPQPGKPKTFWQRLVSGSDQEKIELTDKVKALFAKN